MTVTALGAHIARTATAVGSSLKLAARLPFTISTPRQEPRRAPPGLVRHGPKVDRLWLAAPFCYSWREYLVFPSLARTTVHSGQLKSFAVSSSSRRFGTALIGLVGFGKRKSKAAV